MNLFKPDSDYYSFESIQNLVCDFEALLKAHDINIANGSDLERVCLNVYDLVEKWKNPLLRDPKIDIRRYFSEIMGLRDLLIKIVKNHKHPSFRKIIPHLKLMNSSSVPQNTKSLITDQGSNKVFELFMAAICMQITENIELDDPNFSKGENPDIIAEIDNQKWGFACKVMHSSSIKTLWDRLKEGVSQIENSKVEKGIVIINLKNILNHEEMWPIIGEDGGEPIFKAYENLSIIEQKLQNYGNEIKINILNLVDEKDLESILRHKKSLPGFLLLLQTGITVLQNNLTLPTNLSMFNFIKFGECDISILGNLNLALHNRL